MDAIITFAKANCPTSEWSNWNNVLLPLKIGSLERLLWATAFLKSTNGVADKVSCGHFQKLIAKSPNIDIDIYKNPNLRNADDCNNFIKTSSVILEKTDTRCIASFTILLLVIVLDTVYDIFATSHILLQNKLNNSVVISSDRSVITLNICEPMKEAEVFSKSVYIPVLEK